MRDIHTIICLPIALLLAKVHLQLEKSCMCILTHCNQFGMKLCNKTYQGVSQELISSHVRCASIV